MDIAELQSKMREAFRSEANDLLSELDTSMLELESHPEDGDLLNRVFRAIHTIKGSGATAGFNEMAAFTHHVEELFDEARMGKLIITPAMIDIVLRAKDLIGQLLESEDPVSLRSACNQVVDDLSHFLPHAQKASSKSSSIDLVPSAQPIHYTIFFKPNPAIFASGTDPVSLVDEIRALGEAVITARCGAVPPLDILDPEQCYMAWDIDLRSTHPIEKIKEVFLFVEDDGEIRIQQHSELPSVEIGDDLNTVFLNIAGQSLQAMGGFLSQMLASNEMDSGCNRNYLRIAKGLRLAGIQQAQRDVVRIVDEQIHLLEHAASNGLFPNEIRESLAEQYKELVAAIQMLQKSNQKVGIEDPVAITTPLAELSNLVNAPNENSAKKDSSGGSATIRVDREKLDRLMQSAGELLVARNAFPIMAKRISVEHGLTALGKEVKDVGEHISRIAEDLQAAVMSIRMMPIRTVFQRFPRLVRDICRVQGKEAELVLEGEDTELDKTVIEQIADPLVHLVRNSADHGIELPDVREKTGKSRLGKIILKAYNRDNNVVIDIQDDGQGMDPARLKRKALEKALITPTVAETMTDQEALQLIFLPGFSTAETVTDISGRGVGMDVVRSNIQQLRGSIALESRLGLGSRITITLPASLMVSKGIFVVANGEDYVFPIASVVQMVRLQREQIHCHERAHFALYRGEVYPGLRLATLFASKEVIKKAIVWPEEVQMAIIQTDSGKVGIAVDRFIGASEMIVKPLSSDFAKIQAFQGATIMGDGRVALVINPFGLN